MIAFASRRPFQSIVLLGALLAFAAAFAFKGTASAKVGIPINAVCPNPQGIPASFDYPQSSATIGRWVATADVPRARRHGWNLWAALNSMSGTKPIWQTWCTETQAFAPDPIVAAKFGAKAGKSEPAVATVPMRKFKLHNGSSTGADPINFPVSPVYSVPKPVFDNPAYKMCMTGSSAATAVLGNGPTLQSNGDVMVAGVIYNQPAYNWIRDKGLYLQTTLNKLVPPAGMTRQMAQMPPGSIALKPMMWPVAQGRFTALPVWDGPTDDHDAYAGFEVQSMWPRAVAVTTSPAAQVIPASVTMPLGGVNWSNGTPKNPLPVGPLTYKKPRVVGTNAFYHYTPDLARMAPCDHAILDASAYYAYGRAFQQGDQLVLIAMHIMTKEQPDWTFQSVWWNDMPGAGNPYAADRPTLSPSQAPGPWRNYLMASTYGIPASKGSNQWPVAFNPYIELAADHPIETNCMNCHKRAAWPAYSAEYQGPNGPGALDIFALSNPILEGRIQVDSLWSISDRALKPNQRAEAAAER